MKERKVALVLSFIYCGLGQIYKGEILKGINFVAIYTLLIISLFLSSPSPFLLYSLGLPALLLMWLVGMVDAFIDDEILMRKKRCLIWQKLLAILPVVVVSGAVITLLTLWLQDFSAMDGRLIDNTNESNILDVRELDNTDGSEFFSIQVAAFKDMEKAREVCNDLLSKGYIASIERSESSEESWHRILVGKFYSEQDAISLAEKLHDQEGFSYMIVRRSATKMRSGNAP